MFKGLEDLDSRPLSEEGAWMTLRSPRDGRPIVVDGETLAIKLAGPDSKRYQDMLVETARRFARARAASKDGDVAPEDARRINAECMAMIAIDWRGFRELDGTVSPCNIDRVTRLFAELSWSREQSDAYSSARANFLPLPAAGSPPESPSE